MSTEYLFAGLGLSLMVAVFSAFGRNWNVFNFSLLLAILCAGAIAMRLIWIL